VSEFPHRVMLSSKFYTNLNKLLVSYLSFDIKIRSRLPSSVDALEKLRLFEPKKVHTYNFIFCGKKIIISLITTYRCWLFIPIMIICGFC